MESFSGTCGNICDNANISDNVKVACDAGSLDYCSNTANINSVTCKSYLDRTCKTYNAERTNTQYTNPIKPASGKITLDYVNKLVTTVNDFEKIPGNVISSDINDFINIFDNSKITTYDNGKWLVDAAAYCTNNPNNSNFCGYNVSTNTNNSWFVNYIATKGITVFTNTAAAKLAETKNPIKIYTDTLYIAIMNKMYPSLFTPIETIFLNNLTEANITDTNLAEIRTYSDNLREGIDSFVLNLILTKKESYESAPNESTSNGLDSEDLMEINSAKQNKNITTINNLPLTESPNNSPLNTPAFIPSTDVSTPTSISSTPASIASTDVPTPTSISSTPSSATSTDIAPITFSSNEEIKKDIDDLKTLMTKLENIYSDMETAINNLPDGKTKTKYHNYLVQSKTSYTGIKSKINNQLGKFNSLNTLSSNDQTVFKYAVLSYEQKLNKIILDLKKETTMLQNLKLTIEPFYNISDRFMVSRKWYSKLFNKFTERFVSKTEKFSTQVSDIVNKTMLYNPNVRMFINNIINYRTNRNITSPDPLVTLVAAADSSNLSTCVSSNPLTNTICKSMTTSADKTITKAIQDNIVTYCSNNYFDSTCNTHINNNKALYKIEDIYKAATLYCISDTGKNDNACASIPNLSGIDVYLNNAMKNVATFDSNGKLNTLIPQCGANGTFSTDQCNSICAKYPALCESDSITKCSSEKYRYNTTAVDTFGNKESFDIMKFDTTLPSIINNLIIIILFFIILLLIASATCSVLHTIFCKEVLLNIINN